MENARRTSQVVWSAALAWAMATSVSAETAARLIVNQTTVHLPTITSYLDIRNDAGEPLRSANDLRVTARLDGRALPLTALSTFDESNEGVAYFFLVDVSGSLRPAQFVEMREALDTWIDGLRPNDRIAIASFGDRYRVDLEFTADILAARVILESLGPTDRKTALYEAVQNALIAAGLDDQRLPARRVVVILSDGKDEGSGLTIDDLRLQIQTARVPIYAIGYSNLQGDERQRHLDALHRLATLSGGVYREASPTSLALGYAEMNAAIRSVYIATFSCDGCQVSEASHALKIDAATGPTMVGDALLLGVQPPTWWRQLSRWSYFAVTGLAMIGVVLVGVTVVRRTRRGQEFEAILVHPGVEPTRPERIPVTQPLPQTSSTGIPIKLVTIGGPDSGRVHRVNLVERARVGRSSDCEIVVRDDEISGHHCDLLLVDGRIVLRDLGSTNGTLVAGARVTKQTRLESGDEIALGRTRLRIAIGEGS